MATYAAFGTTFSISTDSGSTYTAVAQVRDISGPSLSQDTVETTHHTSTAAYRTFVPSLLNAGEVSIDLLFDPVHATHDNLSGGLLYAYEQQDTLDYRITWSDTGSSTWDFQAIVTGFEPGAAYDGELSASVTFQLTGQPTLT